MQRRKDGLWVASALAALLAALTLPTAGRAATPPQSALAAAAFIARHPTEIVCDADVNPSPKPAPPGFVVEAWTPIGRGPIHMHPSLCAKAAANVGTKDFAQAIRVVIREAAVAGVARSEACAELVADMGVYDVLRQFYGVPFFTPMSWRVGAQVLEQTRLRPADFQPAVCSWPG